MKRNSLYWVLAINKYCLNNYEENKNCLFSSKPKILDDQHLVNSPWSTNSL